MISELSYQRIINIIHLVVIAPLFYAIGANKFPEKYRKFMIPLAIFILAFHLYRLANSFGLVKRVKEITLLEGMEEQANGTPIHHIKMFDSNPGYSHPKLTINVGDIVVWTNIGEVEHTVTAATAGSFDQGWMEPSGEFHSGYMKPGQTFAIKFIKAGVYPYYCTEHKGWMQGIIIVQ